MSASNTRGIDFAALGAELGLGRGVRNDILEEGLATPVDRRGRGYPVQITPEDAERIRQAVRVAAIAGVAFLIVLRLLSSGAVVPNVP